MSVIQICSSNTSCLLPFDAKQKSLCLLLGTLLAEITEDSCLGQAPSEDTEQSVPALQ